MAGSRDPRVTGIPDEGRHSQVEDGDGDNDNDVDNGIKMEQRETLQPDECASLDSGGLTKCVILTTCITCIGSSLLFGYALAVLNTPTKIILSFYNETYTKRGTPKDDGTLDFLWTVTVSIFVLSGVIGAFASGPLADKYGRKRTLIANHVLAFIAAITQSLTVIAGSPELLMVGRFFTGLNTGASSMVVLVYLNEIAPQNLRGAVGTIHEFATLAGVFVGQLLGLSQLLGTKDLWPLLLAVTAIPALLSTICLPFCPESPKWLVTIKHDEEGGRKALARLRGTNFVENEIQLVRSESIEGGASRNITVKELFTLKDLRMPLVTAIVLQMAQQLSGICSVLFYSELIFKDAGLSQDDVQYAILGTGLVLVIATGISVPLCERLGRRTLLIIPICLMILSYCIMTTSINLKDHADWLKYLTVASSILFVFTYALGIGPLAFVIIGELFRTEARSTATSVVMFVNWILVFIQSMTFRPLQLAIKEFNFLLFVANLVFCVFYLYFFLPETNNRDIDTILKDLDRRYLAIRRKCSFRSIYKPSKN